MRKRPGDPGRLGASAHGREAPHAGLAKARPGSVGWWRKTLGDDEIADAEREMGMLPMIEILALMAGAEDVA
jgi:hypothetical protein